MRLPIRVRISLLHQHAILALRYLFRLPIDRLREQHREELDQRFADTLQQLAVSISQVHAQSAVSINQLNARLHWYETRVPLLRREYKAFLAKQKKIEAAKRAAERKE